MQGKLADRLLPLSAPASTCRSGGADTRSLTTSNGVRMMCAT